MVETVTANEQERLPMRGWITREGLGTVCAAALLSLLAAQGQQPVAMKVPAPELQAIEPWINSKPLRLQDLRGQVVVLHFWAFG
jgi:hypothetical protein